MFIVNKNLDNVVFEYDDYVLPDKERERFLTNQARLWFEPFIDKINSQSGTINFFLKKSDENRVHFNGMDKDLESKLYQRLRLFQVPQLQ